MTKTAAEAAYDAARQVLPEGAFLTVVVLDENGKPSLDFDYNQPGDVQKVAQLLRDAADQLDPA